MNGILPGQTLVPGLIPMKNKIVEQLDFSKSYCIKPSTKCLLSDKKLLDKITDFPIIPKNSLIIVNDHYRSTPTQRIVKLLREAGKISKPITFLIATGSHLPPTENVAIELTGAVKGDNILYHDVRYTKDYSFAGKTSRGTEVFFNPVLEQFDKIITIGSVEPHYFAGFTGGAKSLMPGVVAKKTIAQNHKWAMDPDSTIMKTKGNPVFEDIWEAANLIVPLEEVYSIQLANHGPSILNISLGLLPEAFKEARKVSEKVYGKWLDKKFDRILSFVASPLDKNLYQSQKAIENTKNVLKEGGTMVLIAECSEGIGTADFFERLQLSGTPENVLKTISNENYQFGDHKAYKLAEFVSKSKLLYVGNLSKATASKAYMTKVTVEELVGLYKNWTEDGNDILIDEAGGFTACCLA